MSSSVVAGRQTYLSFHAQMHILFISKLALFVWYLFVVARIAYFIAIFMYFLHVHIIVANNNSFPLSCCTFFLVSRCLSLPAGVAGAAASTLHRLVWLVKPQGVDAGFNQQGVWVSRQWMEVRKYKKVHDVRSAFFARTLYASRCICMYI